MEWFRFYTATLDSPKVQRLQPVLFKAWVNLLCLARLNDGALPSTVDIAFRLRCSERQAEQWIEELVAVRLLDHRGDGIVPHDWEEYQRQNDSSAARTRLYRDRKKSVTSSIASVTRDAHVTSHTVTCDQRDTEQIQIQNRTESINAELQKLPVVVASEWPKSAAVVRRRFQATDEPMVLRIVQGALQAWLSFDQPKIREPDDGLIAEALEICWQEAAGKQTSPALWLQTLPRLMRNWAQHGRPAAPERISTDPKMRAIQEARRKYGSSRINAG